MRGRLQKALFSIAFAALLAFSAGAQSAAGAQLDGEKDSVRVLILNNFPPQFVSTPDGPSGLAVEMMQEVVRRASLDIEFVTVNSWKEVFPPMRDGTVDVLSNMGISEARRKIVDFTDPYEVFDIKLFVRADTQGIETLDDLNGRALGIQQTNVLSNGLINSGKYNIKIYPSFKEAFLGLLSGEIDAVPAPTEPFLLIARAAQLDTKIQFVGPSLREVKRAFAVPKGRTELRDRLNNALVEFKRTDEYQALLTKWYGASTPYWTPIKISTLAGAILVMLVLTMVLWRYKTVVSLNRRITSSEERFRSFAEASADWLWETDEEHRFSFISDEGIVHASTGLMKKNIIGHKRTYFVKNDLAQFPDKWAKYHADLDAHRPFKGFEYSIYTPQGDVREFSVRGTPVFDADGAFKGYRGVASDITGRKIELAALANAKGLLEQAERLGGLGHWEIYLSSGELYWSDEIYRIHGLEVGTPISVIDAIEYYHPDDRDIVSECIRRAIEEKENFEFELRILRSDGELRTVHTVGVVRMKPSGEVASIFGVFHDVTEQKLIDKELLDYRDHLERLVAERTDEVVEKAAQLEVALESEKKYSVLQQEFVSLVSHELRTPLSIIDGTSQRILRHKGKMLPEQLTERVTKIRRGVSRMVKLIDATLYASRLDAGKIKLETRPTNLIKMINAVSNRQMEISGAHKIGLELNNLPDQIIADSKLLEHVFSNLLSNAVKYSPDDHQIEVKGGTEEEQVWVSVTDQGIGIPREDVQYMFGRYFRAENATGISGSGIGLNICKQFVEMHGGTIELDTTEGQGSTFTVRLPINAISERVSESHVPMEMSV